MSFRDRTWKPVYESGFSSNTLVDEFYRPFLSEAERYDRLAGYLSLRSLAHALEGVDSMLETGGTIRVIAGADLQEREKGAMFPDADEPLEPWVESQLAIIATLLERGNLQIKVGEPKSGEGLFHPKLGIGEDSDDEILTFEGSINETLSAWKHNYERFKVHRSWEAGEEKYIKEDLSTFNSLWNGYHPSVDVHDLDEADEQDIINWTDTDASIEEHVERVRQHKPQAALGEADVATAVSVAGRTPGGLHLAEDVSAVEPWPHQRTIADTAVSLYPNNLLFCDEVGLGKTIEAGLTLSRLIHTGTVDNALLLVPAGLIQQWQDELLTHFNIHSLYYDRRHDGEYLVGPLGDKDENCIKIEGNRSVEGWAGTPIGQFVTNREQPTVIIQSWHTARRDSNQSHVAPTGEGEIWDMVAVDEAHSARANTQLYDLLGKVEAASKCLYALTATPYQTSTDDLYDLMRLCDLPGAWDDRDQFKRFFETRSALREALADTSPSDGYTALAEAVGEELEIEEIEVIEQHLSEFARLVHTHLTSYPGYTALAEETIDSAPDLGIRERRRLAKLLGVDEMDGRFDTPGRLMGKGGYREWEVLVDASEWATPVQSRMFRNGRSVLRKCKELGLLTETVPHRDVKTKRISLGDIEPLYEKVETYITETYGESQKILSQQEQNAIGFVMTTYRQRLTSSLYAITKSLKRRREQLEGKADELQGGTVTLSQVSDEISASEEIIDEVGGHEALDGFQPTSQGALEIINREREMLDEFVDELERTHSDPKITQLQHDIRELRRSATDDIIIFTQYHDTLEFIRDTLSDTHPNLGTYSGSGGQRYNPASGEWEEVGKERIKRSFTDGETNILICTESASEGLNLQTADALINYDLPWNPMWIEQRIGRIDRIGQENEVVQIINYAYDDTVDGDIYEALETRLEVFKDVVGSNRAILQNFGTDIKELVMMGDAEGEDVGEIAVERAKERVAAMEDLGEKVGLESDAHSLTTQEEIIESASLDGWDDRSHPDIAAIGTGEMRYEPAVSIETMEQLLTHSEQLRESGWTFTALRNHDRADEFEGTARDAYVLEFPEGAKEAAPERTTGTAQAMLGEADSLVVTFSKDVAEEFPSIRLLLPGDPLYKTLLSAASAGEPQNVELLSGRRRERGPPEIVVGENGNPETADIIGVGAVDENVTDLPGGRSLNTVPATKEVLREWLE